MRSPTPAARLHYPTSAHSRHPHRAARRPRSDRRPRSGPRYRRSAGSTPRIRPGATARTWRVSRRSRTGTNANRRLFWVSFAALYVEIMMIRWIGTEVRVFAYFQNLSLIACFLGFGLGCYWSRRHKSLVFSLCAIVALVILAEAPLEGGTVRTSSGATAVQRSCGPIRRAPRRDVRRRRDTS